MRAESRVIERPSRSMSICSGSPRISSSTEGSRRKSSLLTAGFTFCSLRVETTRRKLFNELEQLSRFQTPVPQSPCFPGAGLPVFLWRQVLFLRYHQSQDSPLSHV